ncbi:MAG: hypothetical protein DDT25_01247 [Chloroflexi bacterium]|nr:hypothetical protein [Chloroflexota bacterium]
MAIGAGKCCPNGDTLSFSDQMAFAAAFPAIGGVGASFIAAQRSLCRGAVESLPLPVDALEFVVAFQQDGPQLGKGTSLDPL